VTTPDVRLDNNAVENAIRALKLGARDWLFVGHPETDLRLANLFTLVESARQAGVDIERSSRTCQCTRSAASARGSLASGISGLPVNA